MEREQRGFSSAQDLFQLGKTHRHKNQCHEEELYYPHSPLETGLPIQGQLGITKARSVGIERERNCWQET